MELQMEVSWSRDTTMARPASLLTKVADKTSVRRQPKMATADGCIIASDKELASQATASDHISTGLKCLHNHRLNDAEHSLLHGLRDRDEDRTWHAACEVKALNALSDICYRQSRSNTTSHPMETHWLMLHAVALLRKSLYICEIVCQGSGDIDNTKWFTEQQTMMTKKVVRFQEIVEHLLYMYIRHDRTETEVFSYKVTPMSCTPAYSVNHFPLTPSSACLHDVFKGNVFTSKLLELGDDNSPKNVELLPLFYKYCMRRLAGIEKNKIVRDLFSQHQKVVAEDSGNFTGDSDNLLVQNGVTVIVNEGTGCDNVGSTDDKNDNLGSTVDKNDNVDFDNNDNFGATVDTNDNLDATVDSNDNLKSGVDNNTRIKTNRDSMDYVNNLWAYTANVGCDNTNTDVNRNTIEECVTSNEVYFHFQKPLPVSPLTEDEIIQILADVWLKLSHRLEDEDDDLTAACDVIDETQKMLQETDDDDEKILKLKADVYRRHSDILHSLGHTEQRIESLKMAVRLYRDIGTDEMSLDVATALSALGNSYLDKYSKVNQPKSIYDSVISAISDTFDDDILVDTDPLKSPERLISEQTNTENSESMLDDNTLIYEALECYHEVVVILEGSTDTSSVRVYTEAIVGLGDCHFMCASYTDALTNYESCLPLYQSEPHGIASYSHIVFMVGVNAYLLRLYPKASIMFECAYRMMRRVSDDNRRYPLAVCLSLLGLSTYRLKVYQKCVTWCFQAFEIYTDLFTDFFRFSRQQLWIFIQTIYILGVSYNHLHLYDRAIQYLQTGREILNHADNIDHRQQLRILQILGDSYFAKTNYKTSLTYYHEALELNGWLTKPENDDKLDQSSSDRATYSTLLASSADAHLNLQDYTNAIDFFEEASSVQSSMTDSVKADLAVTLHSLGDMNVTSGDIDKAIQSYRDSLDIQDELIMDRDVNHDTMYTTTCTNLACLCYIKYMLTEDDDDDDDEYAVSLLIETERNFQRALEHYPISQSYVKYVNYLQHQDNHMDAVVYLTDLLSELDMDTDVITYHGVEKLLLPPTLHHHYDMTTDISLPVPPLVLHLLITSYLHMREPQTAHHHLLHLMSLATSTDDQPTFVLLAHSLMQFSMFEAAARSFYHALLLDPECSRTGEMLCFCCILSLLQSLQRFIHVACSLRTRNLWLVPY